MGNYTKRKKFHLLLRQEAGVSDSKELGELQGDPHSSSSQSISQGSQGLQGLQGTHIFLLLALVDR